MSSSTTSIKGIYAHLDCLLTGIERLKKAGVQGFDVTSPLPRHEIEEAIYEGRPSPVRWWTMTGAIIGVTVGFLLPALTHSQWPMINPGGKPVVALAPFAIIMFECTILLGAAFTFFGMIFHTGLPAWKLSKAIKDPRFSDDKFGIIFNTASSADEAKIVDILNATGAIEVTTGDQTTYEVPNA